MSHPPRSARSGGFTLVELMVVLAVIGVLVALATPAMLRLLTSKAVIASADTLAADLRFARVQALRTSGFVRVCASDGAASPACAADSATDWSKGWIVFVDRKGDGTFQPEDRLRLQAAPAGRLTGPTAGTGAGDSGTHGYVRFAATGIVVSGAQTLALRPALPSTDSNYKSASRLVCVNPQGRTAVVDGTAASCN